MQLSVAAIDFVTLLIIHAEAHAVQMMLAETPQAKHVGISLSAGIWAIVAELFSFWQFFNRFRVWPAEKAMLTDDVFTKQDAGAVHASRVLAATVAAEWRAARAGASPSRGYVYSQPRGV